MESKSNETKSLNDVSLLYLYHIQYGYNKEYSIGLLCLSQFPKLPKIEIYSKRNQLEEVGFHYLSPVNLSKKRLHQLKVWQVRMFNFIFSSTSPQKSQFDDIYYLCPLYHINYKNSYIQEIPVDSPKLATLGLNISQNVTNLNYLIDSRELNSSNYNYNDNNSSNNNNSSSNNNSMSRWSFNTCKAEFDSLLYQRSHFKSDFHRFNV